MAAWHRRLELPDGGGEWPRTIEISRPGRGAGVDQFAGEEGLCRGHCDDIAANAVGGSHQPLVHTVDGDGPASDGRRIKGGTVGEHNTTIECYLMAVSRRQVSIECDQSRSESYGNRATGQHGDDTDAIPIAIATPVREGRTAVGSGSKGNDAAIANGVGTIPVTAHFAGAAGDSATAGACHGDGEVLGGASHHKADRLGCAVGVAVAIVDENIELAYATGGCAILQRIDDLFDIACGRRAVEMNDQCVAILAVGTAINCADRGKAAIIGGHRFTTSNHPITIGGDTVEIEGKTAVR